MLDITTLAAASNQAWVTVDRMIAGFFRMLPPLIIAAIVFTAFVFLAGFVRRAVIWRTPRNQNVGLVLGRLAQWAILFVGILIFAAIAIPTVKPSDVLSILGIGSVAIGFAFKEILQNFLAGILLLLRQTFQIGDVITYKEFEGTVDEVETSSTRIITRDGRRIVIPNSEIFTNALTINTAGDTRRAEVEFQVDYAADVDEVRAIVLEVARGIPEVHDDPAPEVFVTDLNIAAVFLRIRMSCSSRGIFAAQTALRERLKAALQTHGVPVPTSTPATRFEVEPTLANGARAPRTELAKA
jgi:small-conductance mechanosensitive channel